MLRDQIHLVYVIFIRTLAFVIIALGVEHRLLAQTAQITGIGDTTSTPVAGVSHDYITGLNEIVNPADGSLSVRIKVPTPPERGVNWPTYAYKFDSNGMYSLSPTWGPSGSYSVIYHLNLQLPTPASVQGQTMQPPPSITLPSGNGTTTTYVCNVTAGSVFTDPDGGRHGLALAVATPASGYPSNSCQEVPGVPTTYTVGGDAQYKAIMDPNSLAVTVIDNHGNLVGQEDVNGNQTNSTTSTGRQKVITQSGNDITMTFPGVSGNYQDSWTTTTANNGSITIPYTVVNDPVANACQMSSISLSDPSGSYTFPSTETLTLPNGQSYKFTYDPATHMLSKIQYPTGAYVEYTWQIVSNQVGAQYRTIPDTRTLCAIKYGWFAITERQVSYDGSQIDETQTFTYTTNWPATGQSNSYQWTRKQTKVTTTDNKTTKSFDTIYT